jgi:hypothetical protein
MSAPLALSDARRARLARCIEIAAADDAAFASAAAAAAPPPDWQREADPCAGVSMHSTALPGTSLRKYRATGALPGAPHAAARLLWEPAARLAWDHSYLDVVTLGRVASDGDAAGVGAGAAEDEIVLQRMCIKSVLIVSQRDLFCCHLRRDRASDGVCFAVSFAASAEDEAAVVGGGADPAFVRGEVLDGSGWTLRPKAGPAGEQHAEMTYTFAVDLKGWIPHMVVNAAIGMTAKAYFEGLRGALCGGA